MSYDETKNLKGLKEIRTFLGLSQNELALFTGLSQNTISSFENGVYNPTLLNAQKIYYAINHYAFFKEKVLGYQVALFELVQIFPALELDFVDKEIFHFVYEYAINKYGVEVAL